MIQRELILPTPHGPLSGQLVLPDSPRGLVLVAQLRPGPLDPLLAADLGGRNDAILAMPLMTAHEAQFPDAMHNVPLLAQRLTDTLDILQRDGDTETLPVVMLAAAHVTPAAIRAAARRDLRVKALVCHGGLIDLAGLQYLELLAAPMLMLVDIDDSLSTAAFQRAAGHLSGTSELRRLGPGEAIGEPAAGWFDQYLQAV